MDSLGIDTTLEEVSDTMAILNPSVDMAGLSTDYKTYRFMMDTGEVPEGMTYTEYLAAIGNAKRTGGRTGGDGLGSDDPNSEYSQAEQYVEEKSNMSDEALKSDLLQNSDLSVTEINAIIGARTNKVTLDDSKVTQTAIQLIENSFEKKFFSSREGELKDTKDFVRSNLESILDVLKIKDLTESDKEKILQEVNNITLDDISI